MKFGRRAGPLQPVTAERVTAVCSAVLISVDWPRYLQVDWCQREAAWALFRLLVYTSSVCAPDVGAVGSDDDVHGPISHSSVVPLLPVSAAAALHQSLLALLLEEISALLPIISKLREVVDCLFFVWLTSFGRRWTIACGRS